MAEKKDVKYWAIQIGHYGIKTLIESGVYLPARRDHYKIEKIKQGDTAVFYFTDNLLEKTEVSRKQVAMIATIEEVSRKPTTVHFAKLRKVNGLGFKEIRELQNNYEFNTRLGFGRMGFNMMEINKSEFKKLARIR